jgi:hypothetical protein
VPSIERQSSSSNSLQNGKAQQTSAYQADLWSKFWNSLLLDMQSPGLAQQLRIHPKLLRRVLRHFEQEQILAREHRRETAKRRRRAGDAVPDAGSDRRLQLCHHLVAFVTTLLHDSEAAAKGPRIAARCA